MNTMMNNVRLIGNLGSDIELHTFDSGKVKARVSIATEESTTTQNGEFITNTTWHKIEAWGKTAENMNNILQKGSKVVIDGALEYQSYEDKDGIDRNFTIIKVNQFYKIDKKYTEDLEESVTS